MENTTVLSGIEETPEQPIQGDSNDIKIEETPAEELTKIEDQPQQTETPDIEFSKEDCELFYQFIMETGHDIRKGNTKSLPEQRVKKQGELLYKICSKYNIKLPSILQEGILAVGIIADWKYMEVKEQQEDETKEVTTDESKEDADSKTIEKVL
jgi:hypothetical protein